MGMQHRARLDTVKTLTAAHGMAGPRVKQVYSLEETASELGKTKKAQGGSPGALNPVTLTEKNTKTGASKSITVGPTYAYGAGTGAKYKKPKR
jgi:hypothetical protein